MSKIFVVADLSDNKQVAITRACELAKKTNNELHVVYFCYQSLRFIQDDSQNIKQTLIDTITLEAETSLDKMVPEEVN